MDGMTILNIGDKAPGFELKTDNGDVRRLEDFLGKKVVLFFYPKANTPGCTVEACEFRDDYGEFEGIQAEILGISPDTVRRQLNFKNKFDLPFTLLADADHEVAELYGVWGWKQFMGRDYEGVNRTTFIIDEDGMLAHVFEDVKPEGHSAEVMEVLRE
jgi:peroxiredoxin Q/BCP